MAELVNLNFSSEKSGNEEEICLMNPKTKNMAQKAVKENKIPPLSEYQKTLLEEFRKRPEVMRVLTAIFKDYPEAILNEIKLNNPNVSKKKKKLGQDASIRRLKIESWIEMQIAKIIGIDTENLLKSEPEIDLSTEEVTESVDKMLETPAEEDVDLDEIMG